MTRFFNNKRLLALLLSLILLAVLVPYSLKREQITWPEKVTIDVFSWVQKLVYQPVGHISGFVDEVQNIFSLYQENAELKDNLKEYAAMSARLKEMEQRNKQLEQALGFKNNSTSPLYAYTKIPANVTGRDPSKWNSSITIDLGEKDGIRKDMAVVAVDGGLVGRITEVMGYHSSRVLLITDTNKMGIPAMEQDSRAVGIVSGSAGERGDVEMGLIDREAKLTKGQKIVTSHLSTIFPPGIPIGEIVDTPTMEESGLTLKAKIKPTANLDRLETVFVVTRTDTANAGK